MKKGSALVLALVLLLGCNGALAAGKLTVNQETYVPVNQYSYYGYVFAEVENTGDKPIEYGNGIFEILNADGDPMESDDVYNVYPAILAPGEVGYAFSYESVDAAESLEDISDYTLTLSGKSTKDEPTARLKTTAESGMVDNGWGGEEYQVALYLTNDGSKTLSNVGGAYGLYDANGTLLYAGEISAYRVAIPANQTLIFYDSISDAFIEKWQKEDTMPKTIKAIGFVER